MEFLVRLFDPAGFPARWRCGTGWAESPWLGWLHVLSDLGVWSAYLAIPLVLVYFLLRRKDLPFRMIFLLFGAFILACGTTHLMEAIIFWWPVYRLAGVIKLLTALVSWATVFSLFRVMPGVLTMRSPEELEREIAARTRVEQELQKVNAELEVRVQQRTADLTIAADALREERERLHVQEERLRLAVDATGLGIFDFLPRTGQQDWSPRCKEIWGLSRDAEVPPEVMLNGVHPDDRQRVREVTRSSFDPAGPGQFIAEHRLLHPDGSVRWVLVRGKTIFDTVNGKREAIRSLGTVLDITDRKQAEEALQQSEVREKERAAELETVLRVTPTAIWISHDAECRRITGNPASYRLLHTEEGSNVSATSGGPLARNFREYRDGMPVPPDDLPLQKAAAQGVEIEGAEFTIVFDDHRVRHLFGNAVPIRNRDGAVRGAIAAFMDITELKKSEQALKDADHRKDEFLATLAHELRNPLAPIRNSLEVMKWSDGNFQVIEQCRSTMERQLGHMVRLVDDLIDVSRISRNRLELRKEIVELASIIHQAIETCKPLATAANHELNVSLPSESIYLNADSVRMAQVFGNLLTNACKYTEGAGKIWVTVERTGHEAIIKVRDTGIGIPADMLLQIFEMFTQVDQSLERSQSGLGIGLTLVKRLVEMHGGTVVAQSEGLGKGSEFIVRLTAIEQSLSIHRIPAEVPPMTTDATKRRILVVDDNRDSAMSLSLMLKMMGNETQTAHDGLAAIEAAAAFRPDIMLLDIGLPKLNGYDVCRRIRELPWSNGMTIVALTGWGQQEDRRRSAEAGFDRHLVKPVELKELQRLLSDDAQIVNKNTV